MKLTFLPFTFVIFLFVMYREKLLVFFFKLINVLPTYFNLNYSLFLLFSIRFFIKTKRLINIYFMKNNKTLFNWEMLLFERCSLKPIVALHSIWYLNDVCINWIWKECVERKRELKMCVLRGGKWPKIKVTFGTVKTHYKVSSYNAPTGYSYEWSNSTTFVREYHFHIPNQQ